MLTAVGPTPIRVHLDGKFAGERWMTEPADLEQDENRVTACLSTGETSRFDYLAGADGGASFVRKAIGLAFPGTTDESFRMLLGDVAAPNWTPGPATGSPRPTIP